MHAVAIARGGSLVTARHFAGTDEHIGSAPEFVTFTSETLHELRSVTKSVVSLLYGIALERGLVPPLVDSFPELSCCRFGGQGVRLT